MTGTPQMPEPWGTILSEAHVYRDHRFDEFPRSHHEAIKTVKGRIETGNWSDVLGWLEWIFKHPRCPSGFPKSVDGLLAYCRLGYRVFDNVVICPIGSEVSHSSSDIELKPSERSRKLARPSRAIEGFPNTARTKSGSRQTCAKLAGGRPANPFLLRVCRNR